MKFKGVGLLYCLSVCWLLTLFCGCVPSAPSPPVQRVEVLAPPPITAEERIANCLRDLRSQWRAEAEEVENRQQEIKQIKLAYQALRFRYNQPPDFAECQWCIDKVNGIEKYLEPIRADIGKRKQIDAELLRTLEQIRSNQSFDIDPAGVIAQAQGLIADADFEKLLLEGPKMIPWDRSDPDKYMSLD